MDFEFTEEQKIFQKAIRDFLQEECPRTLVREVEERELDYLPELYRKTAELGWLGLMLPEEYGGSGGSWVDMAILYEEVGRALMQSPHFTAVSQSGQIILNLGTEKQKSAFLPKIAHGEIIVTVALTEPEAGSNLALIQTSATTQGGNWVIQGNKLFVRNAHIADYIMVVAKAYLGKQEGNIALFLVPRKENGVVCTPIGTISGERVSEVVFDRVTVAKENLVGKLNQGENIKEILDKTMVLLCLEAMGGAQVAFEMTLNYSKERIQFGVPIGSFQALQHRMSDMAMTINGVRWLCYYVAWLMSQGIPCSQELAMARLCAGEIYRWVAAEGIQIHGGFGAMQTHDIGLYFRRAKALQLSLGHPHVLREIIATSLGL